MIADGEAGAPLGLNVHEEDGSTIMRLSGDLDMETASTVAAALDQVLGSPSRPIVLDLAGLDFIDSTGVRVLLNGLTQAREAGSTLVVRNPRPLVERVLRISGVAEHLGL